MKVSKIDSVPAWVVVPGQGRYLPFHILWVCYRTVGLSPQKQLPSGIKGMRGIHNLQDTRGLLPPEPGKACQESQKGKERSYIMLGRFDGILEIP